MSILSYDDQQALNKKAAIALKVEDRFFYSSKGGRVCTAWSLAGARLYQICAGDHLDLLSDEAFLRKKHREWKRVTVKISEE